MMEIEDVTEREVLSVIVGLGMLFVGGVAILSTVGFLIYRSLV